jgi:hypothetical protein
LQQALPSVPCWPAHQMQRPVPARLGSLACRCRAVLGPGALLHLQSVLPCYWDTHLAAHVGSCALGLVACLT